MQCNACRLPLHRVQETAVRQWNWQLHGIAVTLLLPQVLFAADSSSSESNATPEDRLLLSAEGSTLSHASGGGGGSIGWLRDWQNFAVSASGEYQTLDTAHWAFGSLSGAFTIGNLSVYGETNNGSGSSGLAGTPNRYDYDVEAVGLSVTFDRSFTLQLDTHQFDVDNAHGNLPKIAVGTLLPLQLLTTVSYARSVTGNLGTELGSVRVDHFGQTVNWLLGGATGHVSPPIVNLAPEQTAAAQPYHEGYVGVSKKYPGTEWSLLADYVSSAGTKRVTLRLSCSFRISEEFLEDTWALIR
jgi:hypothetical protein